MGRLGRNSVRHGHTKGRLFAPGGGGGILLRMNPAPQRITVGRPEPGEYNSYYEKYIALVPGNDILRFLEDQTALYLRLFAGRGERDGDFRYAAGKWTVKEALGHVNDTERIFAYRALRIARGDKTPLAGFEQDDYVRNGGFAARRLADLADEFSHVRRASIAFFRGLDEAAWLRRGMASEKEVSVRALAYIIAGHAQHHANLFNEQYFPFIPRA